MAGGVPCRTLARIALVAVMVCGFGAGLVRAQPVDELDALIKQIQTLVSAGNLAEATEVARKSLSTAEKQFGVDHIRTAYELYRLGNMLRHQSQYPTAHSLLLRALSIFERQPGDRENLDIARTLNELGWTSLYTLRLQDAQQSFSRSLAIKEKLLGTDHIEIAYLLDGLAMMSVYASQYDTGARYSTRSLEIKRKRLPAGDNEISNALAVLATVKFKNGEVAEAAKLLGEVLAEEKAKSKPDLLRIADVTGLLATVNYDKGDYASAEAQARESLDLLERNGGTERGTYLSCFNLMAKILTSTNRYPEAEVAAKKVINAFGVVPVVQARDVMDATNTLSIIYMYTDRYSDAEQALKKSLAIAEETFGEASLDVSMALENLAYIYATVDRSAEALDLFGRILRIRNTVLPAGHAMIGSAYANRARVLNRLYRYQEADTDAREGIRIMEAVYGSGYPMALSTRDELGTALKGLRRYDEAVQVYKDSIKLAIAAEGEKSTRIPLYQHNLGHVLDQAGRYAEAEGAYLQSLTAKQSGTLSEAQTRKVLADLYVKMSRYPEARENFRKAIGVFVEAFNKTAANRREYEGGIWLKTTASAHISALLNNSDATSAGRQATGKEAFEISQWLLRTTTSSTLSQLGARNAAASGELAQSVRARQDSTQRWQALSAQLDRLISQPIGDRNQTQMAAVRGELAKFETNLTELDQLLAKQFPAYMELSSPRPVTVDEVQKLLRPDEALIQFVQLDQRFVAWVVTPGDVAWYPLALNAEAIANTVATLRCGLDYDGAWLAARSRCQELLNTTYSPEEHQSGRPLPFDVARARPLQDAVRRGCKFD